MDGKSRARIESILYEYPFIPGKIKKLNTEKDELIKSLITVNDGLKAAAANGMPRGSDTSDPTYKAIIEIERFVDEIARRAKEITERLRVLNNKRRWVQNAMDELTTPEQRAIELFYYENLKRYSVAKQMNYHPNHVCRIRDDALEKMLQNATECLFCYDIVSM